MNHKILCVDDDLILLDFFEEIFVDSQYEVRTANSAKKALEILARESVPVIYTDLQMPEMTGIELCKKVRESNQLIWICAVTGEKNRYKIAKCREAGFDDFLKKPIALDLILKKTESAFNRLERWERKKLNG